MSPLPFFPGDEVRDGALTGRVVDRHPELVRVAWDHGGEPTWHWSDDLVRIEEPTRRAA